MAELRHEQGTRSCLLLPEHLVGRGPQCALRLSGSYVSAQHALIRWNGVHWELLDRGSRNGTHMNLELLESGRAYRLVKGAVITFGHGEERWIFVDDREPQVMVLALDSGEAIYAANGFIGVPSSKEPECTIYLGVDNSWQLEQADGTVLRLNDADTFELHGKKFGFCCPSSASSTVSAMAPPSGSATLHFIVSSDEEFVELSVEYPSRRVPLGSRSHNYLLLLLARSRLKDSSQDIAETACGWLDKEEIADGLRMTPQQVDGEVFRIRKHFGQHGLPEAATIIERRPRTKQLRVGIGRIRIDRR